LVMEEATTVSGRAFTRRGRIAAVMFTLVCVGLVILVMVWPRPLEVDYVQPWKFTLTGTENITGKYNATIEHYNVSKYNESFGRDEISYWFNGSRERGPFIPTAVNAMNWIKNNTADDSVFLSWWPYGHMIRGMAERESIISDPSAAIADTVMFPERVDKWEERERVNGVAGALLATDLNFTKDIMDKYHSKYVLAEKDAVTYMDALCKALGKDLRNYTVYEPGLGVRFVGSGLDCAMYRFINATNVPGFERIYGDDLFMIFKLTAG
jgi:asparagine N-glycosylation enzyme membrane subunit Stt3